MFGRLRPSLRSVTGRKSFFSKCHLGDFYCAEFLPFLLISSALEPPLLTLKSVAGTAQPLRGEPGGAGTKQYGRGV